VGCGCNSAGGQRHGQGGERLPRSAQVSLQPREHPVDNAVVGSPSYAPRPPCFGMSGRSQAQRLTGRNRASGPRRPQPSRSFRRGTAIGGGSWPSAETVLTGTNLGCSDRPFGRWPAAGAGRSHHDRRSEPSPDRVGSNLARCHARSHGRIGEAGRTGHGYPRLPG
jgi:hypothetical protein